MKKRLYMILALMAMLMFSSCRQPEELNEEDAANLRLIKHRNTTSGSDGNNAADFHGQEDGDPIPPPKK